VIEPHPSNGELRRMYADGNTTGTGGDVVARERPLRAFVQRPGGGQGQRMRRDDLTGEQVLANVHVVGSSRGNRGSVHIGAPVTLR
jgi:hypothetical protein